jgi:predicted transcriptional regulator
MNAQSAIRQTELLVGRVRRKIRVRQRGASKSLESLTDISNLVTLYAVRVMVTLGVADHIGNGISEISEIARAVDADESALSRVLRHLVASGVLNYTDANHVELTNIGMLLVTDHPSRLSESFHMGSVSRRFEFAMTELLHSVKTGGAAYAKANGKEFWTELAEEPQLAKSFDIAMEDHIGWIGPVMASAYDWSRVSDVVDIGGGTGALLSHLLAQHHHLNGTLVEYADAAARATDILAELGLASRITVVEGSFFDQLPIGADAYILSWILHDWPDLEASEILRRCRTAAGSDGRVLIVESPISPENLLMSTTDDLKILAYVGGKERTMSDYIDLLAAADLQVEQTVRLRGGFVLIVCGAAFPGRAISR